MKDIYLISCSGQGDTSIHLVDKNAFDWITLKNVNIPEVIIQEQLHSEYTTPGTTEEEIRKGLVLKNGSSPDNDRALNLGDAYPNFSSLKEVYKYIKDNDLNIVDEYEGYIY